MTGLLDYVPGESIFHKMNPVTKLLFAMMVCASCFVSSSPFILALLIAIDIASGLMCGIPSRIFSLCRGLIKLSIFLLIIQLLIIRSGNVLYQVSFIKITDDGLRVSLRLVLRLFGATLPLAVMLSVTKLADLSNALVEKLHVPYKYAFTFTTAVRFIPVFAQEMAGIMEAQTSRGVELDTKNPIKKIALILPLCAPLLVSSVRKTSGTAIAADLRGFRLRTYGCCMKKYPLKAKDILCIIFSVLMLSFCIFVRVSF